MARSLVGLSALCSAPLHLVLLSALLHISAAWSTVHGLTTLPRHRAAAPTLSAAWGGELASEASAAVKAVQKAMQLCDALACEMAVVESEAGGKTMDACDTTAGVSFIKEGDSTPVTAADFAIQGVISRRLKDAFPNDRFMGEEDASDLREDAGLRALALRLCSSFDGDADEGSFLEAIDRGMEPNRGEGERVWILDPIDGTKGFMTGQGYVIGLALVDASGVPLIGVMGKPTEEESPPIMAAVKGHGLRWWNAVGEATVAYDPPAPEWVDAALPPWFVSPHASFGACAPFGPTHPPEFLCCGAMVKYFATAAGRACGFVQYEEELKSWDHACGVICVAESGGEATDAAGDAILFADRIFHVAGGIVCASRFATDEVKAKLLQAADACEVPEEEEEDAIAEVGSDGSYAPAQAIY